MTGEYYLSDAERSLEAALFSLRALREQLAEAEPQPERIETPAACEEPHTADLAPGVWLIQQLDGVRRMGWLGEAPEPMPLAAIALQLDAITRAVAAARSRSVERVSRDGSTIVWAPSDREMAAEIVRQLLGEG